MSSTCCRASTAGTPSVRQNDPNLEARIQSFELAFRMQAQAPEAFEVEKESEATKKLYGLDEEVTRDFGWQCLLARRLAERDVRYIQCTHSYKWDQHSDISRKASGKCEGSG